VNTPFNKKVEAKSDTTKGSEKKVLFAFDEDEKKADIDHKKSETHDLKTTTKLKIGLTIFISLLICAWGWFLYDIVNEYILYQKCLKKEIPPQVMISIITSGASVTGLMAFILKGIFKST